VKAGHLARLLEGLNLQEEPAFSAAERRALLRFVETLKAAPRRSVGELGFVGGDGWPERKASITVMPSRNPVQQLQSLLADAEQGRLDIAAVREMESEDLPQLSREQLIDLYPLLGLPAPAKSRGKAQLVRGLINHVMTMQRSHLRSKA